MPYLKLVDQDYVSPLTSDETIVGRNATLSEHLMEERSVSRRHAKITRLGEGYFLEDLGSRHGTLLNGELVVGQKPLRHGDVVQLASVAVEFRDESQEESADSDESVSDASEMAYFVDDVTGSRLRAEVDVSGGTSHGFEANATLRALLDMISRLKSTREPRDLLQNLLRSLLQVFPSAERGFIGTLDREGDLVPQAVCFRSGRPGMRVPVSRRVADEAVQKKKALLVADALVDPDWQGAESVIAHHIRSLMCVPFFDADEQPLGIIQLDSPSAGMRFGDDDLKLLVTLSPPAAFVVRFDQLHRQALARKEIDQDLEVARRVQENLLPSQPPALDRFEFYSYYRAARVLGGDFYDYVQLPNGQVAVVIADVAGKGIAAALYVARLAAEIRHLLRAGMAPIEALHKLNNSFATDAEERFVTLALLVLDPQSRTVDIINAGHWPPILRTHRGAVRNLGQENSGLPIGVLPDQAFRVDRHQLARGSTVVLFSDGFVDAENRRGERFGLEQLHAKIGGPAGNAIELGQNIVAGVMDHMGTAKQADDLSLVCIRLTE